MNTRIQDVQIIPIRERDGLVGFASFTIDNNFYMGSIGVHTRPSGGLRLLYPTSKVSNNSIPIFHPINSTIANEIEEAVVAKFEKLHGSSTINFKI
jgi:DNA-binding cell septation regulator SpoVG